MLFCRNISYPYGDSNRIVGGRGASDGKHFIPLWGQQHLRGRHGRHSGRNISYPYGDSNVEDAATAVIAVETFRSPMGTATGHAGPASKKRRETFHTPTGTVTFAVIHRRTLRRNISYPYGDSNLRNCVSVGLPFPRNISYPYGDSNSASCVLIPSYRNISYPYGDSNFYLSHINHSFS